jgi:hypothetical protein
MVFEPTHHVQWLAVGVNATRHGYSKVELGSRLRQQAASGTP